jgi:hypothetical protein
MSLLLALVGSERPSQPRGDDAFKSAGAARQFWRAKAEEWLQDRLEAIHRATKGPARDRKRLAGRILAELPAFVSDIPEFTARADALAGLAERLLAPQVDYTQIYKLITAQLAAVNAWNTQQRRRRDLEALLILAA